MNDTQFSAQVLDQPQSQVAVIEMHGDINILAEAKLNAAYTQAAASDPARILLNFSNVEYINSTGIALIVALLARARKEHRAVTASGLSDHYREVFEITRLADFMTITTDETSAVTGAMPTNAPQEPRGV